MFKQIHAVVHRIPRGKVATYGSVARAAGFPGAARQVVWALRQGTGLPWHRVIAAGGKIALPGEAGFEQRLRLEAEGVLFNGARVNMKECEFNFKATQRKKPSGPAGERRSQKRSSRRK